LVRAVLFDFDYTLADSSRGTVECLSYALERAGLPLPGRQAMLATVGLALPEAFARLAPGAPPGPLVELFAERADRVMADLIDLYPDTAPTLQALWKRGWPAGVVSTKFRRRIEQVMRREGLLDLLAVVVGGEDVLRPKPDPEGLLWACRRLDVEPGEVVYVGDSVIDGQTARAAGAPFIAVTSGPTTREELQACGAVAVLDRLAQLVATIERLPRR